MLFCHFFNSKETSNFMTSIFMTSIYIYLFSLFQLHIWTIFWAHKILGLDLMTTQLILMHTRLELWIELVGATSI